MSHLTDNWQFTNIKSKYWTSTNVIFPGQYVSMTGVSLTFRQFSDVYHQMFLSFSGFPGQCLCVWEYVFVCVLLLVFTDCRIHLFSSLAARLFNKRTYLYLLTYIDHPEYIDEWNTGSQQQERMLVENEGEAIRRHMPVQYTEIFTAAPWARLALPLRFWGIPLGQVLSGSPPKLQSVLLVCKLTDLRGAI